MEWTIIGILRWVGSKFIGLNLRQEDRADFNDVTEKILKYSERLEEYTQKMEAKYNDVIQKYDLAKDRLDKHREEIDSIKLIHAECEKNLTDAHNKLSGEIQTRESLQRQFETYVKAHP